MDMTIALITLRGLAQLFGLQGYADRAKALNDIAAGLESGKDVDVHMRGVADALKSGSPNDWLGVTARIDADRERLHQA